MYHYQKKEAIVADWYRQQLKEAIPALIAKWELLMGVKVEKFFVQRMKTKWGSCSPGVRSIHPAQLRIGQKMPRECLEYIVVNEIAHLLKILHNARFTGLIDRFMPK